MLGGLWSEVDKEAREWGMIDAGWLSGTRTEEDSRSTGLITATRDAHIIVIFIKHRSYVFAGPRR